MDSSDSDRGYSKREREDEDWEFSDKQKDRSRKFGANGKDDGEGFDGGAKRKRSSRTTTDGDDYDSRSKHGASIHGYKKPPHGEDQDLKIEKGGNETEQILAQTGVR